MAAKDRKGSDVNVGDVVLIPCTVVRIYDPKDGAGNTDFTRDNIDVEPVIKDNTKQPFHLSLKSWQQVDKAA